MSKQEASRGRKVGGQPKPVSGSAWPLADQLIVICLMRSSYQLSGKAACALRGGTQRPNRHARAPAVMRGDVLFRQRGVTNHVIVDEQHNLAARRLDARVARGSQSPMRPVDDSQRNRAVERAEEFNRAVSGTVRHDHDLVLARGYLLIQECRQGLGDHLFAIARGYYDRKLHFASRLLLLRDIFIISGFGIVKADLVVRTQAWSVPRELQRRGPVSCASA